MCLCWVLYRTIRVCVKDLNEHRIPGARRVATDELEKVTQDALGVGGRTDLGARQALTRQHRYRGITAERYKGVI